MILIAVRSIDGKIGFCVFLPRWEKLKEKSPIVSHLVDSLPTFNLSVSFAFARFSYGTITIALYDYILGRNPYFCSGPTTCLGTMSELYFY